MVTYLNEEQKELFVDIYKTVLQTKLSKSNDTAYDENRAIYSAVRIALHTVDLMYNDTAQLSTVKEICDKLNNRSMNDIIDLPTFETTKE
jgi:hypothetical protein